LKNIKPVPKYLIITGVFHCCCPFSGRIKVIVPTAAVAMFFHSHHISPYQQPFRNI
jgi:hypothetical protein